MSRPCTGCGGSGVAKDTTCRVCDGTGNGCDCCPPAAPQDWRTLPAGRALNALVAERVLGAMIHEGQHDDYMTLPGERPVSDQRPVPDYSTDIAAAWQVVERHAIAGDMVTVNFYASERTWEASIYLPLGYGPVRQGEGEAAPLAICRAALAAVEGA